MDTDPGSLNPDLIPSRIRRILALVKLGFVPVAVGFIVYFGWQSRESLETLLVEGSAAILALAVVIWTALHFLAPVFTSVVLGACGSKVSYRISYGIHARRLPARYVPGGVWHTVARVIDFRERGVRPAHLAVFVFLEHGLAVAVTFFIGGLVVFSCRGWEGWGMVAALGIICGAFALCFIPVMVNRKLLRGAGRLSFAAYAKGVVVVAVFWAGAALGFLTYLSAFPLVLDHASWLEVSGTYMFSWGIGFVFVFAPQGIGIFEAVVGDMLRTPLTFGGVAALVAGFRIVVFGADLMAWAIALLLGEPRGHASLDTAHTP